MKCLSKGCTNTSLFMTVELCYPCSRIIEQGRREWVNLTDVEIAQAVGSPLDEVYLADFRKVIEKLKEKNT